jgi:hypothetical protein
MKAPKLLVIILAAILLIPISGCNLIGQNPLSAIGSLVPQTTAEATVEATTESIRPKTVAATAKPKATTVKTVVATIKPKATINKTPTKKNTAVPSKTVTSSASFSLPVGAVLLSDDFSDPTSGWAEASSDQSEMGYQDGKYVITVHNTNYLAWTYANQTYSDFVLEVAAAKVSGPSTGEYGVLFRIVDNNNFYIFKVNMTGSYLVSAFVNAEWVTLIPWTKNTAIKAGTASNKLGVIAQGDSFSFYANDVKLDEITDSNFTQGDIALVAGTQAVGEVVASFSSVNVWETTGGASPTSEASAGISKGTKLYSENFADSSTGWDVWDGATSRGGYENGKYFIEVLQTNQLSWGNAFQSFDDFVIEVDTSKVAGPDDNAFGIILRYVDVDNFYFFAVSSDGQYKFSYYKDNVRTDLIPWALSDAVNQGNTSNKLSVACKGNHFILSINGTVVEDFTDDTFSSGDIGLFAGSRSEAGVKITFDNLNVWAAN